MNIEVATFPMDFRVTVRHSSAVRSATENIICIVTSDTGERGVGEGCPREYVTGETVKSARRFLLAHSRDVADTIHEGGVEALTKWVSAHSAAIDENPAAFAAIELALLDLAGREAGVPVEDLVGQPRLKGAFHYTAVLGDSPYVVYTLLLHRYLKRGFRDLKLKLSGDLRRDRAKVGRLRRREDVRVRFDANNLWATAGECVDHMKQLDLEVFAIEEPLSVGDLEGFAEVAEALHTRIVLDESAVRSDQLMALPADPKTWILNCRVSKMGGLLRSIEAVKVARTTGMGVIVGAQVGETSILTRAALPVAAAGGDAVLAQEGAFGTHLLRQDLAEPVVMFDRSGRLSTLVGVDPEAAGFGLVADSGLLTDVETVC